MIDGVEIDLGTEKYILPPMALGDVEKHQKATKGTSEIPVTLIIDAIHAALKRNYPELSRDVVAQGIDVASMNHYMSLTLDTSGLLRKAFEEKVKAVGTR